MNSLAAPPVTCLEEAVAQWKESVETELKGVPFEKKLVARTFEEISLQPLYTRADLTGLSGLNSLPGEAPFLRGARAAANGRHWEIAQEISSSQLPEFNRQLLANLNQGQDAVVLAANPLTRHRVQGEKVDISVFPSGRGEGLPLHNVRNFATALEGIDLHAVPLHLPAGGDPRALAALYFAWALDRNLPLASLTGSVTGDPLGEAAEIGCLPENLHDDYDGLAEWTRWAAANAPQLDTVSVDLSIWGHAGASAVQELALALATAAEYLRELLARGLPLAVVSQRIRFKFSIGSQFFTEIAKFRAFRLLWSRVIAGFGGELDLASGATVAAVTSRWNKSLLDPQVNLLRVTTEALAAVLGGCDSLNVAPFDEVSGYTTALSRRIALNVQTMLAEEFGCADPADPAGGSWYVEKFTDDLARAAWTLFQDFEKRGGLAACLRTGYAQQLVEKVTAARTSAIAHRRSLLVGVNLFPNLKETPLPAAPRPAPKTPQKSGTSISPPSRESLAAENLFPAAIKAARQGACASELQSFFCPSPTRIASIVAAKTARAAEGFESLRRSAHALFPLAGRGPKVFFAKIGPPAQYKARSDFSAAFFAVGGFEVIGSPAFDTPESAAAAAAKSGARVAVLCSSDETYPALAPPFAQTLKTVVPDMVVVLAGLPADPALVIRFREAGFTEFIHARANAQVLLASLLKKLGAAS